MGKSKDPVKDEKLFLLIRNLLLTYLPVQRGASKNSVTVYRTVLNQSLKFVADRQNIPVPSVTSDLVQLRDDNRIPFQLGYRERLFFRHMEQPAGGIESFHLLCLCLLPGVYCLIC